jgi:hypothetical protein
VAAAQPNDVLVETIDAPPTDQQPTNDDQESASLSKEDLRAMMTAFAEMNFAIRDMSDRVGKLEFKERK